MRFARGFTTLRTETHKLILGTDGSAELYAWPEDPGEEKDLAGEQPELVKELQTTLRGWQKESGAVVGEEMEEDWEIDPTTVARLRALGYIE
jgi:hypothetical protein